MSDMASVKISRMTDLIPTRFKVNETWVPALSAPVDFRSTGEYHTMIFYALCPREEVERMASHWNIEANPLDFFMIAHDADNDNFDLRPTVDTSVIATLRELIDRAMKAVMGRVFTRPVYAGRIGDYTLVLTVDAFRDVIANFDNRQIGIEWEISSDIDIDINIMGQSIIGQKPPSRPVLRLDQCEVVLAALEYPDRPGMKAWVQYGDYVVAGWDAGGVQLLTDSQHTTDSQGVTPDGR